MRVLAVIAGVVLASACVRTSQVGERFPDAGTGDAGCGDGGCVVACYYDDDCALEERCDDATRRCIPAGRCQDLPNDPTDGPSTCRVSGDEWAYCEDGSECLCVASPMAQAPYTGFCKRRRPPCAPCTTDAQCGDDPTFFSTATHNEAYCVQVDETDPTRYCLERFSTRALCPCGKALTRDGRIYCAPQEPNTCAQGGVFACCASDENCPPAHPVCDSVTGLCRDRCHYDFAREETVGCRGDLACNVDPDLLDERSLNFAAGRCAPPCTDDPQCSSLGADFRCITEADARARCRPAGCLDNLECADPPAASPYVGFCDLRARTCVCDPSLPTSTCYCRGVDPVSGERWTNPRTGGAYNDCKPGFTCATGSTARNQCVEQTCAQAGGAAVDCARGEFCCGEDRDGDGDVSDDACVESRAAGGTAAAGTCYPAPRDIYCLECAQDADCRVAGMPQKTSSPADTNRCAAASNGVAYCEVACGARGECPAEFSCSEARVTCTPGDAQACGGRPERCTENPQTLPNGAAVANCACATPLATGDCPAGARCSASGGVCVWGAFCQQPSIQGEPWCATVAH